MMLQKLDVTRRRENRHHFFLKTFRPFNQNFDEEKPLVIFLPGNWFKLFFIVTAQLILGLNQDWGY